MQLAEGAKVASTPDFICAGDMSSIPASMKSGRVDTAIAIVEPINQAEAEGWAKAIFTGSDDAAWNEYLGADIAAALCLRADFTLAGRSMLYGAISAGEPGATKAILVLADEMRAVLAQIGCTSIDQPGSLAIFPD